MIGGLLTSTVLTLVVIPAIYYIWQDRRMAQRTAAGGKRDGSPEWPA
jgi:hypothetical protein